VGERAGCWQHQACRKRRDAPGKAPNKGPKKKKKKIKEGGGQERGQGKSEEKECCYAHKGTEEHLPEK